MATIAQLVGRVRVRRAGREDAGTLEVVERAGKPHAYVVTDAGERVHVPFAPGVERGAPDAAGWVTLGVKEDSSWGDTLRTTWSLRAEVPEPLRRRALLAAGPVEDAVKSITMTQTDAAALVTAFRALGVEAQVRATDYAPKNADGTYTGEVKTRYSVTAVIRDARHGNTVVRELREPSDVAAVVADMQREVTARAKVTRSRIRAERDAGRS